MQQASGQTVQQWCVENEIKPNTYYNHLKRVREQFLGSSPAIVPLNVPQQSAIIRIEKNGLHISLPTNITQDTLPALVNALCLNGLPAGQQVYLVTGYTGLRRLNRHSYLLTLQRDALNIIGVNILNWYGAVSAQ